MPATYAHKKFGEDVQAALGERFSEMAKFPHVFALGLHGPDPLFYYRPLAKNAVKEKGDSMHEARAAEFFDRARHVYLARGKRAADRAYLYAFACHFCLDSVCHGEVAHQMQRTGLTHVGIEAAFERMLLLEDGRDPLKAKLTAHIQPEEDALSALAAYCGVTKRQAKKAVKSMRFYSALLRAPNALRRSLVHLGLRLAGKYRKIAPMMIPTALTAAEEESCAALRPLYDRALAKALALIPNLAAFLSGEAELDERFASNFESEAIQQENET